LLEVPARLFRAFVRLSNYAESPEEIEKVRTQTRRVGKRPGPRQSILGSTPQGHGHSLELIPVSESEIGVEVIGSLLVPETDVEW